MTHAEHLAAAASLYADLELAYATVSAESNRQAIDLAIAQKRIVDLETRIAELEATPQPAPEPEPEPEPEPIPEPAPVPPSGTILHEDTFKTLPGLDRYVTSRGARIGTDIVLRSPGNLAMIFTAGRVIDGWHYDRTELMRRDRIGSDIHRRDPLLVRLIHEVSFTIPADYNPHVSSKPNERRNLTQWHQFSGRPPALALEVIKPSLAPYNGTSNYLRLVLMGSVVWYEAITPGTRFDTRFDVVWSPGSAGRLVVTINGAKKYEKVGPTCYSGDPATVAQHIGPYLPGADDDPAGGKTEILYHLWRVTQP